MSFGPLCDGTAEEAAYYSMLPDRDMDDVCDHCSERFNCKLVYSYNHRIWRSKSKSRRRKYGILHR